MESSSPYCEEVAEADFEQAVLGRSAELPVVVDFWAPWCGPCRVLGPALEREVAALGGRVRMAKVNVDECPGLAAAFQIRSIPKVIAFKDGQAAAAFEGARDPGFIRAWLEALSPSPQREALERAIAGRDEAALRALTADPVVGSEAEEALARLEQQLAFIRDAEAGGGEAAARAALAANDGDLEARWTLAAALAGAGRLAEALDQLLELVARSRKFRDDGARKAILTLLADRPPGDDLARDVRRRLQVLT